MRFFLVILAVLLLAMMPLQTNAYLAVFESSTCGSKADTSASINQCISSNGVGLKFTCGSVTNTSATVTLTGYSDPTTCGSALLTTTSSAFNFGDCTSVTISGGSTSFTFGVKTDCSTTTTYSDASAKFQVSSVFSVAIAMAVMVAVSLMM